MSGGTDPLDDLSASIADGEAIDWDAFRALAGDDEIRHLLEHLRVVARVAEVHRSQIAETIETPPSPALAQTGPSHLEAPKRWGHLLLVRKIGEGAFGEVYEALDTWLDHPRALKLLKPEVANRVSGPQILHEARKLVRVRHPNVVMVHGADSHDGRVGFWMDLIEGQTLEQRVREGRLSPGEAIYVGQELCRAVAAVHHANLLHRDIKAQNVMRASDGGRILLMDFGAGEFRDAPTKGRAHGTPLYLAPELLTGGSATVQSDIYALGVLLYYLVTGRFPIEGKSFSDIVLAHATGERRHLRDARPDLPDFFVTIVDRAIDPDPARRFQSAGDLHAALDERDRPPQPAPIPVPVPVPSPAPLASTFLAAIAILGLVELCGFLASRMFDVVLHVDREFATGPRDYLAVGIQGVLPFAFNWLVGIAIVALLGAVRLGLRHRLDPLFAPWKARLDRISPSTLATLLTVAAGLTWIAICWWHWSVFETLFTLQAGSPGQPDSTVLGPTFYATQWSFSQTSAILTFFMFLAVWRWWPVLEHRADELSTVRRMKWTTIVLIAVIIVAVVSPRRLAWDRFEVVLYKNRPYFVIASNGEDLLLYAPDSTNTNRPRVRRDAADVVATGERRRLVERPTR